MRKLQFHSLNFEEGKKPFLEVKLKNDHPEIAVNHNIKSDHAGFVAKTQFGLPTGANFIVKGVQHQFEKSSAVTIYSCLPITEIQAMVRSNGQGSPIIHQPGQN